MIFNTWDYYFLFLIPTVILFRISRASLRPWIIALSGCLFFAYFSYTQLGGAIGAACLLIFLWETLISRFYKPASWFCWLGVTQTILFLVVFKYRNFLSGLIWPDLARPCPKSTVLAKRFSAAGDIFFHF
jgi:alginate O-acetyltransferase complex protein AlgI